MFVTFVGRVDFASADLESPPSKRLQAPIFARSSARTPRLGSDAGAPDERGVSATAHDAAKINASQRANVRLARSGGVLRAQCVERKQPPPQGAPTAHMFNPTPLFLFPPEHPESYSYLVCKWFDGAESDYDSFIMSQLIVFPSSHQVG